jgi:hypothetical protein
VSVLAVVDEEGVVPSLMSEHTLSDDDDYEVSCGPCNLQRLLNPTFIGLLFIP